MSYQRARQDRCRAYCSRGRAAEEVRRRRLLGDDARRDDRLVRGTRRRATTQHYRLFCLLDYEAKGHGKPLLVVVDGRLKAFQITLSDHHSALVRALGQEYRVRNPRSVI